MLINTTPYTGIIHEVLIDNRENTRVDYALKQYKEFNPRVTQLTTGDYIFIGDNEVKVCFEYKTEQDFLTSIQNNHLHNQVYHMTHEYDYHYIIWECKDIKKATDDYFWKTGIDITMEQINGAISTFNTETTLLIIPTQYLAFDLMMRTAGKTIQQKPIRYKHTRKTENPALNYLSSIRGVDDMAEIITKNLNLTCHDDLMKLTSDDLKTIPGIGDKKAEKIMKGLKHDN